MLRLRCQENWKKSSRAEIRNEFMEVTNIVGNVSIEKDSINTRDQYNYQGTTVVNKRLHYYIAVSYTHLTTIDRMKTPINCTVRR